MTTDLQTVFNRFYEDTLSHLSVANSNVDARLSTIVYLDLLEKELSGNWFSLFFFRAKLKQIRQAKKEIQKIEYKKDFKNSKYLIDSKNKIYGL